MWIVPPANIARMDAASRTAHAQLTAIALAQIRRAFKGPACHLPAAEMHSMMTGSFRLSLLEPTVTWFSAMEMKIAIGWIYGQGRVSRRP